MADKAQPDGHILRKVTEDDDVEGHRHILPRDGAILRKVTEDEDVEGHSMLLNPLVARELAQARERDVQKNVKRHGYENDARSAKKDQR